MSLLLAMGLLACWSRAPGPAAFDVAEGPVATFEERVPANAVDLVLAVRAGSAHDPVGQEGLAWLTAHALQDAGGAALSDQLYALGTDLRIDVGPELAAFHLRCRVDDAAECAELLGQLVTAPAFDAGSVERVGAAARHGLVEQVLGPADQLADSAFDRWAFEGHPYGHLAMGRLGTVGVLSLADVQQFHANRYLRPATALGIAGQPTAEAVVDVQAALGGLPPRLYRDVTPRRLPGSDGVQILVVQAPVTEDYVVFGHTTELAPGHSQRLAVEAALAVLGSGPDSRLGRVMVDRGALDGQVDAALDSPSQRVQPAARVSMRLPDGQLMPLVAAVQAELARMKAEGPTDDELSLWRAAATGQASADLATPRSRAHAAAVGHLLGAPSSQDRLQAVAALTVADVAQAAQEHLRPDDLRVVVVTATPDRFEGLAVEGTAAAAVSAGEETPDPPAVADYGVPVSAVILASSEELLR